ncbi:DUF2510 domain-containing protein [Marmoricola sp. RAF53]|uniref:DUF2510 domain-containing protein n=1 Tax=Marmoricola sp. RAF53 TaxID=3233059 RepID=UPI003F94A8D8
MTNPQANWHPDPSGRFDLRYWDGTQWTEHVTKDRVQGTDPLSFPPPVERAEVTEAGTTARDPVSASAQPVGADEPAKQGYFARKRDERKAKEVGRDKFESLALRAATGEPDAMGALPAAVARAQDLYRGGQLEKKLWATMAAAVRSVIDDDVMTQDEESHLHRLGEVLGTPVQKMETEDYALFEELVIAGINDGRFPRVSNAGIMLKKDEVAYGSFSASLMKEQAVRQFRAGTQSVSIPLGGGVRYRVGGVRGRSVVVGSELIVQDSGLLYVTSQRSVFTGQAKTLEFRHDRLVNLEQYNDGIRLNVSNRQTASLFRMQRPSIAAAMITAAVSEHMS